ncbi:MAG: glycoside hydrolase family 127 protein [Bacteroidales bacterium]|nr:glycoside hydrolase family 127 protein [Bacteroidales bacterium]
MKKSFFIILSVIVTLFTSACTQSEKEDEGKANLAIIATPSSSSGYRTADQMEVLNDGLVTEDSENFRDRAYIFWTRRSTDEQWIQYDWKKPVSTDEIHLFWLKDSERISTPSSYTISYFDGNDYVPVKTLSRNDIKGGILDTITIDQIETKSIRLTVKLEERQAVGLLEWKTISSDETKKYAPLVNAGIDRSVMTGGKTYLRGSYKSIGDIDRIKWKKESGPGTVKFADNRSPETTATFSKPGKYSLSLKVKSEGLSSSSALTVKVHNPPQEERLNVVYTKKYKIDNQLVNSRAKAIIVNWIPWCIDQINRDDIERGSGGIDNFIEAAKALKGEPYGKHKGYVFSNAWVHQTIESMSIALMVDPQGDKEIIAAQEKMKKTLEEWIPVILSAQEPDGYLQTAYTLRDTSRWKERWSDRNRHTHEGYVAGYFIESAINHYTLTEGTDTRLYDAAKKLADCWVDNIGPEPGKQEWYDGHQEMEQALVRFGRFVNDMEGNGKGDDYIDLAKFLLDNRGGGSEYDQSHIRVQEQYEAVGHAVRAVYNYSGMADVAAETGDMDYQSAVMSLWDNMVNKKYYVTGGVGSGETSEGFGPDYSLRHNAYCESCSSCGLIFFQYKMNLAYHDAKYADLYEETMYNALMGSLDTEGKNFYYTNPLTQRNERYSWHVCPCCVGNIPRTLLMIPTWTYVKDKSGIYVNLFIGSTIKVDNISGTDVEMVQETNYPWEGNVDITVNPEESREFSVFVRIPDRNTSELYTASPQVSGLNNLAVNGEEIDYEESKGYAVITRKWEKGDKISFEVPLEVQVITSDEKVKANRGLVALRYGPLVFSVENTDQEGISEKALGDKPLSTEWREDLMDGIISLKGEWEDGSQLTAIPYFTRNNRDVPDERKEDRVISRVWINKDPE